jgi:hypothetical protein
MPCIVTYEFVENQLDGAGYYISGKRHTNENSYLDDYETIKALLLEKYGDPISDTTDWKNPLYRSDPSHYGFAVSVGHLSRSALWSTPRTRLGVTITGDNYEVAITVFYQSVALLDAAEKAKAKAKNPF